MLILALPVAFGLSVSPSQTLFHYCTGAEKVVASQGLVQKGGELWQLKPPMYAHGHDWVSGTYAHIRGGERLEDIHLRLRVLPDDLIAQFPDGTVLTAQTCP